MQNLSFTNQFLQREEKELVKQTIECKGIPVSKLLDDLFIAIVNTVESFYIQKFNSNLDKVGHSTYILLDSSTSQMESFLIQ